MQLKELIQEINDRLSDTEDISVLTDWDNRLCVMFATAANELGETKKTRAIDEIKIKGRLLAEEGKYTEKAIEREYFSTPQGQFYALATEQLKALSKLISAIRFRRKMLSEPLN